MKIETSTSSALTFRFHEANVRVHDINGDPWFVAADVCRVLGLDQVTNAIRDLDEDEKMTLTNDKGHSGRRGGAQFLNIISESGLYSLVFRSRKPDARAFSRWVRKQVLPAIRKTGTYTVPKEPEPQALPEEEYNPYEERTPRITALRYVQSLHLYGEHGMHGLQEIMAFSRFAKYVASSLGLTYSTAADYGLGKARSYPEPFLRMCLQEWRGSKKGKKKHKR